MKIALLPLLALLAAACGASVHGDADPPASRPPAAALATRTGVHRLAYSTYCWRYHGGGSCVDAAAPRCSQRRLPRIHVRRGERVRFVFVFAFRPSAVEVTLGRGPTLSLRPAQPVARVRSGGVLLVDARGAGGDASYAACLRVSAAP